MDSYPGLSSCNGVLMCSRIAATPRPMVETEPLLQKFEWHGFQFGRRIIGTRAITFSRSSTTTMAWPRY